MLRKLRVNIGPSGRGRVVDAETGENIAGVRKITIRGEVNTATVVELELIGVELEADIEAEYVVHPKPVSA